MALSGRAIAAPPLRVLPQPSEDIDCADTPFGRRLMLGGDAEFIELLGFSGNQRPDLLHEWGLPSDPDNPGAPAYTASIDTDWSAGTVFSGATLLKAVRADLNGDGQDEIVVAARLYAGGTRLGLGVLERQPDGTGMPPVLTDTWTTEEDGEAVDILAGDLDGSQDGHDELALMLRRGDDTVSVLILTGSDDGAIAQDDEAFAGRWNWEPPAAGLGQNAFTAGAMVLDGKDQILVVSETDQSGNGELREIRYHLLEFRPTLQVFPVLDGDTAVGTRVFRTQISNEFRYGIDGGDSSVIRGLGITRIDADAGDVVADATAEFVTHYEFETVSDQFELHERVQHFVTTRSADDTITDIQLRASNGVDFDDGIRIGTSDHRSGWDAVVRNIDDDPKAEIVLVRNDLTPPNSWLDAEIRKVAYDLAASFTWYRSGRDVQFTENSVGYGVGPFGNPPNDLPRWDFGDGATANGVNPTHRYGQDGTYDVTLRIGEQVGDDYTQSTYEVPIVVAEDSNGNGDGGVDPSEFGYRIRKDPLYASHEPVDNGLPLDPILVAVDDMDRDGFGEIMAVSRQGTDNGATSGLLRSRWRLRYNPLPPNDFTSAHLFEHVDTWPSLEGMAAVAADFDGDSVQATLGSDCRRVEEAQMREMVWAPPYFARLQTGATHAASFGQSTTGGSGQTRQFGTFTSHDVSGYIGAGLGFDFLGLLGVEASARAMAGHYEQVANGGLVGSNNDFALDRGMQSALEGLLVYETNTFECYTYDVSQAAVGIDPDSSVRFCEIQDNNTYMSGSDPEFWDREFPQVWAAGSEGHPPPNWAPLTRDWANLALFRPVRTNAMFASGSGAANLTDGRFTSSVESQAMVQPYVEIDLGSVRPITNIRVFAPHGELASDLTGFRVYASTLPMPAAGLPTGDDVHVFAPDSIDGVVYDRWNIWTRAWNSSEPGFDPGAPLRARYVRLQHPGEARVRVGELQVFGGTHNEPPAYPDAVCDPTEDDGLFLAKVWDDSVGAFREIEIRGDMLWNGTGPNDGNSWDAAGPYLHTCENNVGIIGPDNHSNFDIGFQTSIGNSGDQTWSFSQSGITTVGTTTSFESSTRVGAEFDLTLSAFVSLTAGGAEEFESGVTEDEESVNYWGKGVDVGGGIGGFQPPYNTATYVNLCHYGARPYAYRLDERSDTGYLHSIYAVDYVVPESGESGATAWTRANMPAQCLPEPDGGDRVFASGFDTP